MSDIRDFALVELEGMPYAKSSSEKSFAACTMIVLIIWLIIMIIH